MAYRSLSYYPPPPPPHPFPLLTRSQFFFSFQPTAFKGGDGLEREPCKRGANARIRNAWECIFGEKRIIRGTFLRGKRNFGRERIFEGNSFLEGNVFVEENEFFGISDGKVFLEGNEFLEENAFLHKCPVLGTNSCILSILCGSVE